MDGSMPGFSVSYHLPEFAQVHGIGDAIQACPLLSPSSPSALNRSLSLIG